MLGTGRRTGHEADVEMAYGGRPGPAEPHLVPVQLHRNRVELEPVDAGLLRRLPERRPGESAVLVLAVTAEMEPGVCLGVQGQQHVPAVGGEDQGARGEVVRAAAAGEAIGLAQEVVDVLLS